MSQYSKRIIRAWVDVTDPSGFVDINTGSAPTTFNAAGFQLQVAFGIGPEANGVLLDLTLLNAIKALIWTGASQYVDKNSSSTTPQPTRANWNNGTDQHAVFDFLGSDVSFDLSVTSPLPLKLTFHGSTSDATTDPDVFALTTITFIDAGITITGGFTVANNVVPGGATYDGSGHYTLTGLTVGKAYRWTKGANDTSFVNNATTISTNNSLFVAAATTVQLNGTAGQAVTAIVWVGGYISADEAIALIGTSAGNIFGANGLWLKDLASANYYRVKIDSTGGAPALYIDENSGTTTPS